MAQRHLGRERASHTLQRTALVHEALVRLVNQRSVEWQSRGQFFGLASKIMRRILVDHARARLAAKRSGSAGVAVSLDQWCDRADAADAGVEATPTALQHLDAHTQEDVSAIDQALSRLERLDARQAQIVEMRYFGGLSIEHTAEAVGISEATVKRDWTLARAWLRRELGKAS